MKTKTIFKTLAFAMMMPAMMLTTACSSEDDLVNNTAENTVTSKGYALPVTVNVTRGDATTRATYTYDEGTKKGTLSFSEGDKLFVSGFAEGYGGYDYEFAGELTWQSGKTFSGTIYTSNDYSGTADALFKAASGNGYVNATLLPAGYGSYGFLTIDDDYDTEEKYDDFISYNNTYTLATSKADGVAQFSYEKSYNYDNGFDLSPENAILNFTISGLAASTDVLVSLTSSAYNITGTVTTDAFGTATFAAGVEDGTDLNSLALTVAGNAITLVNSSTELTAGHIYNIARNVIPEGAISGQFSVSNTKKVYFSKGNLRYASGTWSFFDHQYDYYTSYSAGAWDHFGWSTSANTYGMSTSGTSSTYSGNFVDWGATMGSGWRTLSRAEWTYLFNTRTVNGGKGSGKSYTYGQNVNNVLGVVLYPDDYTGAAYTTGSNWSTFESAGCVFLPAAGSRDGTSVNYFGSNGYYWSGTANGTSSAYRVSFYSSGGDPQNSTGREYGCSVRLVRDVE